MNATTSNTIDNTNTNNTNGADCFLHLGEDGTFIGTWKYQGRAFEISIASDASGAHLTSDRGNTVKGALLNPGKAEVSIDFGGEIRLSGWFHEGTSKRSGKTYAYIAAYVSRVQKNKVVGKRELANIKKTFAKAAPAAPATPARDADGDIPFGS